MRIDLITLFPEMCETVMAESIIGRARKKGAVQVCCHQLRDYAHDKHSRVDDSPFGGGMGMLLLAEPIALCFDDIMERLGKKPHIIYMSPQGRTLTQIWNADRRYPDRRKRCLSGDGRGEKDYLVPAIDEWACCCLRNR